MAGDWIPFQIDTPDKPEVFAIASYLMLDPDAVVGKLIRVWGWFNSQTRDGNARGVTLLHIDRISHCQNFGEAMLQAGWLQRDRDVLSMPNFDRHNSNNAKTRAMTRLRVQRHRSQEENLGNDGVTDEALPTRYHRREENNKTTTTTRPVELEEALNTGIPKEIVEAWFSSRERIKWTLTVGRGSVKIADQWRDDLGAFERAWIANEKKGKTGSSKASAPRKKTTHELKTLIEEARGKISKICGIDKLTNLPMTKREEVERLREMITKWNDEMMGK